LLQYVPILGELLDKLIPDADAKQKAKANLQELALSQEGDKLQGRFAVITAEAQSDHWVVASWRPITMLTFVGIVANNYILAPYIQLFFSVNVTLELPPHLWELLKIGLGGYVVGRTVEKTMKTYKQGK
jgi:hypothetical protein